MCIVALLWSCADEDNYSVSSSDRLTFSADTIHLDTIFSNIPSASKSFWVFNHSGANIRLQTIRLERGNQSGFRVNVDGVYLGQTTGYQTNEVEVRRNDSIRVFVELTPKASGEADPKKLEDNIVFTTEGGAVQKVNLDAYSWDAVILDNPVIQCDTTITGGKPIIVYGGMTIDSLATLTLAPGTTLYFRDEAGLDVYGRLLCQGEPDNEVVLRGYRIDRMFDYLPYDGVSGQWQGIHLRESSYENVFNFTDIHSAFNGIEIDSCDVEKFTLQMNSSTVHNCQGYGILNHCSWIELNNCVLSNALHDCLCSNGGNTLLFNCTLAQFYPFSAYRGVALRFTSMTAPVALGCYNTLVTGYADDEIMGEQGDTLNSFYYEFRNSILRTPKVTTADSTRFIGVVFEDIEDTITTGKKHFLKIDTDNLQYNFRLDSISPCIDNADASIALPTDRDGRNRDTRPDIGAYEWTKETESSNNQ